MIEHAELDAAPRTGAIVRVQHRHAPCRSDLAGSGVGRQPAISIVGFGPAVHVDHQRVPVTFEVEEGKGRLRLGSAVTADLEPFQGATGESTTLHDSVFTTIPGSPAYLGKAPVYKATSQALGLDIDLQNHNAVQGSFLFEG